MQSINTTLLHWLCQNKYRIVQQNKVDPIWKVSIELQDTLRCHSRFSDWNRLFFSCVVFALSILHIRACDRSANKWWWISNRFSVLFNTWVCKVHESFAKMVMSIAGLWSDAIYGLTFFHIHWIIIIAVQIFCIHFCTVIQCEHALVSAKTCSAHFCKVTRDNVSRMRKKTQILTNLTNLSTLRC